MTRKHKLCFHKTDAEAINDIRNITYPSKPKKFHHKLNTLESRFDKKNPHDFDKF
jgi:hypothetical protein